MMSQERKTIIKKSWNIPFRKGVFYEVEIITAMLIIILISSSIFINILAGFILPLFIIVSSISFILSSFYPRSGIYAIVFLTFVWERFFTLAPVIINRQEYKIYSLDILIIGVILGIVFRILSYYLVDYKKINILKKKLKHSRNAIKYFVLFVLLVTGHFMLDIFIGRSDPSSAFSSFKYYTFYPLLYLIIMLLFNEVKNIKRLFYFALAGGVVIILFTIYGIINGGGLWTEFTPLSTGGIRILAFTHGFYLTMLWLGLFIYIFKKRIQQQKYFFLLLIGGVGILGSMMRHLWLGLGFSLLIVFFVYGRKKDNLILLKHLGQYFPAVVGFIVLLGYLTIIFPHSFVGEITKSVNSVVYERVASFANVQQDSSFSWRELAWRESLVQYRQHPIYGLGFGQKIHLETMNYHDFVEVRNIHNSWLVLFVQSGVVISGIFIAFLINVLGNIFQKKKNESWIKITVVILLLNYFFLATFQPYLETNMLGIFFWMLLGLVSGTVNKKGIKKDSKRRAKVPSESNNRQRGELASKIKPSNFNFKK